MEFDIPLALADLEQPQREGALGPKASVDVAGMSDAEAHELVERVAYDLCENDALCILEQDVFDNVVRVRARLRRAQARRPHPPHGLALQQPQRVIRVHRLAPRLRLGRRGGRRGRAPRARTPCYACLVYHLSEAADAEARADAGVAAATSAPGAGKADKKAAKGKGKAQTLVEWKWEEQRERVMHVMAGVLDVDLWNLFRPRQPGEQFLGLFSKLACLAMDPSPLRARSRRSARSTCSVRAL